MSTSLVFQLARFGDILQTKRLLHTLQARGETHLCVDASLVSLARMVYPGLVVHGVHAHNASPHEVISKNRKLFELFTRLRPDAVYTLNLSGLSRVLSSLFDPETVHGYALANQQPVQSQWTKLALRWTQERRISPINLVDFWAFFTKNPLAPETVNPPAKAGGKGLGVVLAGTNARRSVPPMLLAGYLRVIFELMGGPAIYLLGSTHEKAVSRQLIRHLSGRVLDRVTDLCGRTDWAALQDVLCGLDRVLTPDTGTMHLAAHLGVPVTAFFLSSAWAWETGPYGSGHTIWQANASCAPCLESRPCPFDVRCATPFADQQFLRCLAGKDDSPQGLWSLQTTFDNMGQVLVGQHEEQNVADERMMRRALLAEWLGLQSAKKPAAALVNTFYQEADWMLPTRQL